jgi:hypothetical protein
LAIFNRIPKWAQIAPVYAVIVLVVYSWMLISFFWVYPSWLRFLNLGEILNVLAYSLVNSFLESLAVVIVPVIVAIVLPSKWFYDAFVARSLALILPGLGYMMYIAFQFQEKLDYPSAALDWAPVVLAATLLLVFIVGRVQLLRKVLEGFADRATIFLFLSIPASVLSIISVGIVLGWRWLNA